MSDTANIRMERIKRLLDELRYEVERGMMEREVDEHLIFRFIVPISQKFPNGVVVCEFRTRPMPRYSVNIDDLEPRLKLVKP